MITVTCDVCKKKMENPLTGVTFHYYSNHSICEPCKDNLELQAKSTVRKKEPFAYEWYEKYMLDTLDKAVQKGKV